MLNWFKDIPKPIWIFSAIWLVLGCFQAGLMELHPDEAYYWQMSRFMDWGYFHQPPMVAVFIKAGYWLFQNEFGVRLVTVLSSTIGILLLFKLSVTKDYKTFLLIYLGMILTHAGVFMAVPDSPLIFFTLIFLVLLKEYLERNTLSLAITLGIIAAALMYSKYHAIVLFGSIILAAPKLLLRKTFWLTVLVGTVLYLPHVLWQFEHDLVSFKFHWVVREKKVWDVMVLLDYLLGQLIMLGPVGVVLVVAQFKFKNRSEFQRILTSVVIGFFGFFLIMAMRGKVEANWTASAFLPLIILGTGVISKDLKLQRYLKPAGFVMLALLVTARIYLVTPFAGDGIKLSFPLQGWQDWAQSVKKKADGKPVVFANSYQLVSQYSFYSGEQGYHFSPLNYNGNQFELWDFDKTIYGEDIALILGSSHDTAMAINADGFRTMYAFEVKNYYSYRNLRFEFDQSEFSEPAGSILKISGKLVNRTGAKIDLDSLLIERPAMMFYYFNGDQTAAEKATCQGCEGKLKLGAAKPVSFSVKVPTAKGKHFFRFGLDFALGMPEQNSDFLKLEVVN